MGILDRVSTILRANINALLDQAEDPELVLTQILSDMKDAIAQARAQVAEMIAQEKLFQGDMEKNQGQAQEWARKAELALGRGSEELAKEALRRKVDYDRNASSYMQQLIAQQQVVTKLKSDLNALQTKYDSAMRNRESMIARHKAAIAQQKIAATAQQLSAIDPSSEIARMDAKIRELTPRMWGQSLSKGIEQINTYLRGWSGYFRICTEENVYRLLRWDAHIRRRLRAILVQQKKRPRHLSRHLQQRGVSLRGATQAAYCRRGTWYQANTYGMTAAYPNAWFHERLVSLASTWEVLNPRPQLASGQTLLFDL